MSGRGGEVRVGESEMSEEEGVSEERMGRSPKKRVGRAGRRTSCGVGMLVKEQTKRVVERVERIKPVE